MTIVVFATETTTLPAWGKPLTDPEHGRVMQLAAVQFDGERRIVGREMAYFKPDGWVASQGARNVHRIPERRCALFGVDPRIALNRLMAMVATSKTIASHAIVFNKLMIEIELVRIAVAQGKPASTQSFPDVWRSPAKRWLDITEAAAAAANEGKNWKLPDAHQALVGEPFDDTHDAGRKVEAAARVLWRLIEMKKVEI